MFPPSLPARERNDSPRMAHGEPFERSATCRSGCRTPVSAPPALRWGPVGLLALTSGPTPRTIHRGGASGRQEVVGKWPQSGGKSDGR
jgi:hypothetical protein